MSLAVLTSRALTGMEAPPVTVEVHLANGLPSFTIVGLPELEVRESKDRVRAALLNARFEFPSRRITVNLAPADLPKDSGRFDLPIAIGILVATGQIPGDQLSRYEFAGELALTGELRPIRGALAMALKAHRDGRAFVLPKASAVEAALVRDAQVLAADSLLQVCAHLNGRELIAPYASTPALQTQDLNAVADFADVKGQVGVKRALEVPAAGRHSVLMMGPPGTGKTMLAQRLLGILPPMNDDEALEAAACKASPAAFDWNAGDSDHFERLTTPHPGRRSSVAVYKVRLFANEANPHLTVGGCYPLLCPMESGPSCCLVSFRADHPMHKLQAGSVVEIEPKRKFVLT